AEDGIRDRNVTGVQTCALPISAVRIETRIEDLDVSVSDPARVLFQVTHVDSSSSYINKNGFLGLGIYQDSSSGSAGDSIFDNAEIGRASCREGGEVSVVECIAK